MCVRKLAREMLKFPYSPLVRKKMPFALIRIESNKSEVK